MNNEGQISVEYILVCTIIILLLISTANIVLLESEKNVMMDAAQRGALVGIDKNAYAMYYNDTFNNYQENYPKLLNPNNIELINITIENSDNFIKLQVYLHSNDYLTSSEKYIIGSRVNYYIRKSISETLNLKNDDLYYENIEIRNKLIETKTIKWV